MRAFGFSVRSSSWSPLTLIAIVLCRQPMGHVVKKIAASHPSPSSERTALATLAETLIGSARYAFRRWQDNQALRRSGAPPSRGRRNLSAYKNEASTAQRR